MTAPFFPLDPFTPQRLPLRQMAGELLPAALILRHYHSLKKQEYRRRLPNFHELEKQLRLPQMFLAGGLAALLAGNYLQGPRPQWPHRLGYARLFSLWANYLILADAASDQKELGPEASREFLRQCLVEIFQPVFEGHSRVREVAADLVSRHFDSPWLLTTGGREAPRSPLGSATLRLARLFGQQVAACLSFHHNSEVALGSFALFTERVLILLQGQWASLEQCTDKARPRWEWYRDRVLDAKFTNVLFAPLALLSTSEEQDRRREVLEQGLRLVNALYLHRQLLDDLLDVDSDCREGILGGPAYLLLALEPQDFSRSDPDLLHINGLGALPQIILRWIAAQSPEALTQELATRRAFQQAWLHRPSEAARLLQGSQTVQALLYTIRDPRRIGPIYRQLNNLLAQEPAVALPLRYYQYRCARTFRKMTAQFSSM